MARENLRLWKWEQNLRGYQIASRLGIDHSTWSNIESGKRDPSYRLLVRFQQEFNPCDIIKLFEEGGEADD